MTSETPELPINVVKVFSATKSQVRDRLGEQVTAWLSAHPSVTALRTTVLLSSDSQFHCLSIVLVGHDAGTP
jgi:hypothetical protein